MINLEQSSFFLPTKEFRELSILLTVLHEPNLSQQAIASKTDLSGSMVNGYIRELTKNSLIAVEARNKRDKLYKLTEAGRRKLMNSLMNCSAEIVQLYSQAKTEIINKLKEHLLGNGSMRLVLYGGADTAQLVNNALEQFPHVHIAAIVDNDASKWGVRIGNHVIQSPLVLENVMIDCIIISSFARQNEIYTFIKKYEEQGIKIIRLSTL